MHESAQIELIEAPISLLSIVEKNSRDFLSNIRPALRLLSTGHIPVDADVTPMDNSGSHKKGVSRTCKGHDGYAPMAVYLGQEGYCIDFELREGKQHCQKDTPALLARALRDAHKIAAQQPLLLRLDSGNDAIENIEVVLAHNEAHIRSATGGFSHQVKPSQSGQGGLACHCGTEGELDISSRRQAN